MEFVRHRVFSFAQESTRYCDYSKDKFGNELTFITPSWYDKVSLDLHLHNTGVDQEEISEQNFISVLYTIERIYLKLIEKGLKPQEARAILPNALKTELVMTGFIKDWRDFFDLRMSSKAHPDACKVATELCKEFREKHLL